MRRILPFMFLLTPVVTFPHVVAAASAKLSGSADTTRNEPQPPARWTGMFRYLADAARFRDCRSGLQWPVAMSGDYLCLERAYTRLRSTPGAELKVSLEARIEPRPKMEGTGTEPSLVVEVFLGAMPGDSCSGSEHSMEVANNRWVPTSIGDRAVTVAEGQREPWIMLDPLARRLTGSGGCNRISGSYQAAGDTLRFGPVAATKMACPQPEAETAFLRALGDTRRYRISGRTLELLGEGGKVLARMDERNLR